MVSALLVIACIVVILGLMQFLPLILKALNALINSFKPKELSKVSQKVNDKPQKSAKMIKREQKRARRKKERELRAQGRISTQSNNTAQSVLCEFSNGAQLLESTNNNELSTLKIKLSNGKIVFVQKDIQGQVYIRANEPFCKNKGYMLLKEGRKLGALLKE